MEIKIKQILNSFDKKGRLQFVIIMSHKLLDITDTLNAENINKKYVLY